MKKLKLHHLIPYLEHKLMVQDKQANELMLVELGIIPNMPCAMIMLQDTSNNELLSVDLDQIKPILRPMSEVVPYFEKLYGNSEHQDVTKYLDIDFLYDYGNLVIEDVEDVYPELLPYGTIEVLFKHHFDVFELIKNGLAKNILEIDE